MGPSKRTKQTVKSSVDRKCLETQQTKQTKTTFVIICNVMTQLTGILALKTA